MSDDTKAVCGMMIITVTLALIIYIGMFMPR
jgi:hypothetical protein